MLLFKVCGLTFKIARSLHFNQLFVKRSLMEVADYHMRFVVAIEFISSYVHQRNLSFRIHNNDFVDKIANIVTNILILFLSNSAKRKLYYETNAVFGKVVTQGELLPNRQIIRDEVSGNIIKNGERMKVKYRNGR